MSSSPPSPRSFSLLGTLHENDTELHNNCTNIQNAERKHGMQAWVMALDGIQMDEDDQDELFIQLSVDTVYASYAAAQNRVWQYTQLLELLKREEILWAERVEKAKYVLPDYKSRWAPQCLAS
ncbi:hypothetical protein EDD22DRAFT_849044 [Suillus occidentalis]|nr:hypothetical protein EDD22DRAFT_849044 [Suillus occidentalis]